MGERSLGERFKYSWFFRNRSGSVSVASCSQWWIPVPIVGKPCAPEPVVLQSTASLRNRQPTPHSPPLVNSLPPLPQHLYLRPIPEALSHEMRVSPSQVICFAESERGMNGSHSVPSFVWIWRYCLSSSHCLLCSRTILAITFKISSHRDGRRPFSWHSLFKPS